MFGIGAGEFVVILIVGLIVFGPGKLPEVGRALGKVLREFRKAQAALSATLNDIEEPVKKSAPVEITNPYTQRTPEKIFDAAEKISDEKNSATEKISTEKISGAEKNSVTEKNSSAEKISDEKISDAEKNPTAMTVDDVINLAKARPIVKENSDEKNSNGNPDVAPADDAGARVAGAGGGADGADKQSRPATH